MFVQSGLDSEGNITIAAPQQTGARPHMDLHVPGQLAALGTGVLTLITFVRLLSRVRSDMHGEVACVLEHFPTIFAGVIPLVKTLQSAASLHDVSHQTWLHWR